MDRSTTRRVVLNAEGRLSSDVDRTAGEAAVRGEGLRSCVGLSKSDDEVRVVRMELVAGVEGADEIIKRDLQAASRQWSSVARRLTGRTEAVCERARVLCDKPKKRKQ